MNDAEMERIVRREFDQQGECESCGWFASISEYDLPDDIEYNERYDRLELPCLNKNGYTGCRGVGIYLNQKQSEESDA